MNNNKFEVITAMPNKNDPYLYLYNNKNNNGQSLCINGRPTNSTCNVLSNCVGWACARFNHIYNLITGYSGIKYPMFCCNAENFIEVATNRYHIPVGNKPQPGAIIVWQKGTLSGSDGVGHVAVVEKVVDDNTIITSESSWGGITFNNMTRVNTNGNWGGGYSHQFRGFIYNPAVNGDTIVEGGIDPRPSPNIPSKVNRDPNRNQIFIKIDCLRVRENPSLRAHINGLANPGYYNYTDVVERDGYKWYKIGNKAYVAYNDKWINLYESKVDLKIGDKIRISRDGVNYNTGKKFSGWVYNSDFYVLRMNNNRIVFSIYKNGEVSGAVDKKYITKVN